MTTRETMSEHYVQHEIMRLSNVEVANLCGRQARYWFDEMIDGSGWLTWPWWRDFRRNPGGDGIWVVAEDPYNDGKTVGKAVEWHELQRAYLYGRAQGWHLGQYGADHLDASEADNVVQIALWGDIIYA